MRSTLVVIALSAVLATAFYFFFAEPQADAISLASESGSKGTARGAPLTETAVLFGMLVAVGITGSRFEREE